MVARNRVWLARRNLPAPVVPLYLGVWLLLTLVRRPSVAALKVWFMRLQGRLGLAAGTPAPHEVAYGMAADPTGPAAGRLTSSDLTASGAVSPVRTPRGPAAVPVPDQLRFSNTEVSTCE